MVPLSRHRAPLSNALGRRALRAASKTLMSVVAAWLGLVALVARSGKGWSRGRALLRLGGGSRVVLAAITRVAAHE
jgi:hypothetical protein